LQLLSSAMKVVEHGQWHPRHVRILDPDVAACPALQPAEHQQFE